jgi:hypothetical protein
MYCINDGWSFTKYITNHKRVYSKEALAMSYTVWDLQEGRSALFLNYRLWYRMHEVLIHEVWRKTNNKVEYLD